MASNFEGKIAVNANNTIKSKAKMQSDMNKSLNQNTL